MTVAGDRPTNFSDSQHTGQAGGSGWQWQNSEGLPYLTCSLLSRWSHGFFTRDFSPQGPIELTQVLAPGAKVYRLQQVHGNAVVKTGQLHPVVAPVSPATAQTYVEADGLVAEREFEALWVCSADCVPVLIADDRTGLVAAVHAGWRGTAAKILPEAIAQLVAAGSQLENLKIAMGPAIAGKVYQVSVEVAASLGAAIAPRDAGATAEGILEFLQQLPESPVVADPEPGKVRLDVRLCNALQLQQLGIDLSQVTIAPFCTYSDSGRFFSYRRDRLKKIQWSGIVSAYRTS
ncbi:peptidoglycan editing factor PgeF [Microcoleus sp. LEGE 07076]|uniref:peptidoglycan editing factor PgeF n=1 Tax=Microcoleus sp. LEGE 07076 TaxID=915322 RepID=UPI00188115B2|nr:peptidoglycan editing factor PgeF [Microcoleus sp. LEGE 07076]MBE9185019.1 peptidoglycan editing factor PgeF [Microcoleus sp. LEGE 07076]